jgi:ubiquinone/menaquinone biosynthesis C-methylase UbiE
MNWHDTIEYIRKDPSYSNLVKEAYFSSDLKLNVELFSNSDEFKETLKLITTLNETKKIKILDIGAGNGISTIAFALHGFDVTSVEPDTSNTIGSGAINELKLFFRLNNIEVYNSYAEELPFNDKTFDIVYARQTMHHAYNLEKFSKSLFRVLKNGGFLLTVRDHVVKDYKEKKQFLKNHPLHKFYGGENAFTLDEYKNSFINAGFVIKLILEPTDNVINYSPWSKSRLSQILKKRFGNWATTLLIVNLIWIFIMYRQKKMPGRLYSFVLKK